jgi:hypothetical protein
MRVIRFTAITALLGSACVASTAALVSLGVHDAAASTPTTIDIVGPGGSGTFGDDVFVLSNGNFVVTDSTFSSPTAANVGAVYLYSGTDQHLISTLSGLQAGDRIGTGGVQEVTNSNFVVESSHWHNGAAADAGAVTWIDGAAGLNGVVTGTNSLVGAHSGDRVGTDDDGEQFVIVLANGNYVVDSPNWSEITTADVGAVTWADGSVGLRGTVADSNSVVGSRSIDEVGRNGVRALTNGNYVIGSSHWRSGAGSVGAATWANGASPSAFAVGATNSLVGTRDSDHVGADIVALRMGNYVVGSPEWSTSTVTNVGAATWGNGSAAGQRLIGPVSAANSLVGVHQGDEVGDSLLTIGGIFAVTSGNYVVVSTRWDNAGVQDVGAVTLGNGFIGGTVGAVTTANSLYGSHSHDLDRKTLTASIVPLANGDFVIPSPLWDNGSAVDVGAVTWANGFSPTVGAIGPGNSVIGSVAGDRVGTEAVALNNDNYVVSSPNWDNGAVVDAGASTLLNGTHATAGSVSPSNSLVGSQTGDMVSSGTTIALNNGNYVVSSKLWSNGSATEAGASTWGSGTAGIVGPVTASNSIVGSQLDDHVGETNVSLAGGDYVAVSPDWNGAAIDRVGAATFGTGTTGRTGAVSTANSIIGSNENDAVGNGRIDPLTNGTFLVTSTGWNGTTAAGGAVTFGGVPAVAGPVTSANSVLGAQATDIGPTSVTPRFTASGAIPIARVPSNTVTLFFTAAAAPSFTTAPPNVTAAASPGVSSAVVAYSSPIAAESVGTPLVACTPASGSSFPLGITTVTCTATNVAGQTATTLFTVTVMPLPDYVPLSPARLADTRPGHTTIDGHFAGTGTLTTGSTFELPVLGRGGVPGDAVAVTLNVTVTEASAAGFVTVFPCGSPQPTASNLNYDTGSTIPNAVITKVGADGAVCVFTQQAIQVVVDVNGAYPPSTSYAAINPARVLDTRAAHTTIDGAQQASGGVGAASITTVRITGRAGVPVGATAVALNVTVTEPSAPGFASVFPCGSPPPTASNLNYTPGQTIPNLVIAKIGAGGAVCIFSQQPTQLVADVLGFFPATTSFSALVPARLLDSRPGFATIDGASAGAGVRPTGTVTTVHVAGRGGVPAIARTAVLNVTVTNAAAPGFVTVYPCGIDPPLASNLNFSTGQSIANAILTKIGTDENVCIVNSQPTDLVVDVTGYFP